MYDFFRDYDFKKHVSIVTLFYMLVGFVGNGVLFGRQYKKAQKEKRKSKDAWMGVVSRKETARAVAVGYVKKPSKPVKIFNGIIGACFIADLLLYPVTKRMTKEL